MTKTFKQFLEANELSRKPGTPWTFEELLHNQCSHFFTQSRQEGLLVRGMTGYGEHEGKMILHDSQYKGIEFNIYRKTVRKNRKPLDTSGPLHKIIDDWFEENMGIRARSEAVFCFGEAGRQSAMEYGPLVVILPIGKFSYVWSPKVTDLFEDVITKKLQVKAGFTGPGKDGTIRAEYIGSDGKPDIDAIHDLFDGLGYTINGFSKAVSDAVEIMIDCESYFVIPLSHDEEIKNKQLGVLKKAFIEA